MGKGEGVQTPSADRSPHGPRPPAWPCAEVTGAPWELRELGSARSEGTLPASGTKCKRKTPKRPWPRAGVRVVLPVIRYVLGTARVLRSVFLSLFLPLFSFFFLSFCLCLPSLYFPFSFLLQQNYGGHQGRGGEGHLAEVNSMATWFQKKIKLDKALCTGAERCEVAGSPGDRVLSLPSVRGAQGMDSCHCPLLLGSSGFKMRIT